MLLLPPPSNPSLPSTLQAHQGKLPTSVLAPAVELFSQCMMVHDDLTTRAITCICAWCSTPSSATSTAGRVGRAAGSRSGGSGHSHPATYSFPSPALKACHALRCPSDASLQEALEQMKRDAQSFKELRSELGSIKDRCSALTKALPGVRALGDGQRMADEVRGAGLRQGF